MGAEEPEDLQQGEGLAGQAAGPGEPVDGVDGGPGEVEGGLVGGVWHCQEGREEGWQEELEPAVLQGGRGGLAYQLDGSPQAGLALAQASSHQAALGAGIGYFIEFILL